MNAPLLGIGGGFGPDRALKVEMFEAGGPNLTQPCAGQHAHADDRGGALVLSCGQRITEPGDLVHGQEPFPLDLHPAAEAQRRIVRPHLPGDGQIEDLAQHLSGAVGPDRGRFRRFQRFAPPGLGLLLRRARPALRDQVLASASRLPVCLYPEIPDGVLAGEV